jgi:hypothetical protein
VGLLNPHLDDAALADIWSARQVAGDANDMTVPAAAHLAACGECRSRYGAFTAWLEGIRVDGLAEADEVFTADRLAAQHAQVLRRLEALEHPARVIAFPKFTSAVSAQPKATRRWIAAAAAAGLVAGIGLGQLLDYGRSTSRGVEVADRQMARVAPPRADAGRAVQPVSQVSDDILLNEFELASLPARVPDSLQYLNAVTPTSRDYDPR